MSSSSPAASAPQAFTDAQVVILRVQGGDYAVPIHRVQEIVRVPEITRVPHAQAGVEGVINLRGGYCRWWTWPPAWRWAPPSARAPRAWWWSTVAPKVSGSLVDGVSEVLRVGAADVEPPSVTTTGDGPTAVLGVAKLGDRLVLLLDLDAAVGGPMLSAPHPRSSRRLSAS